MARSSSSFNSESLFDVLIRVNALHGSTSDRLQLDKIVDKFGLYVIDFSINKSPALNVYIYRLCIEACKENQENPLQNQLQALTQSKSKHRVIIFDGLNCFNYGQFKSLLPDDSIMESISVVREADPFNLLVTIFRYFSEQAALNRHLNLIIIYCDDSYIRELMEFLILRKLSLFVILISYNVTNNYVKGFYHGEIQGIEFLSINLIDGRISVKKTNRGKVKGFLTIEMTK